MLLCELLRRNHLIVLVDNCELCCLLLLLKLMDPLLRPGLLVKVLVNLLLKFLEKWIILRHFGWATLRQGRHSIILGSGQCDVLANHCAELSHLALEAGNDFLVL